MKGMEGELPIVAECECSVACNTAFSGYISMRINNAIRRDNEELFRWESLNNLTLGTISE